MKNRLIRDGVNTGIVILRIAIGVISEKRQVSLDYLYEYPFLLS